MKQILVIDDNISLLKQVAAHLSDNYEVFLAKSGDLALQICQREKLDLILLDVEMPGMDGFEFIARLKQNPWLDLIPVIFLIANQDTETEVKALQSGVRDFITKPVEKSILLHRIEFHLGYAAYQAYLEQRVTVMSDSIAASFAELIEYRDENTGGHMQRTAKYMDMLGQDLIKNGIFKDLTLPELKLMVRAVPLHDIGKIAISDRILLKDQQLDDQEFSHMKRHADIGAAILDRMYRRTPTQRYLRYASLIAASHHERFDGKGYPWGLKGDDIPLCGRIMAVADMYDALTNNRVYRRSMSHSEACVIVSEGRGAHFDPRIVDAFENIKDEFYKETDHV